MRSEVYTIGRAVRRGMVIAAALAIFVACAASRPAEDMSPGEKLFRSKCGACHIRPRPTRFTRAGWEKILAEHRLKRVPLTDQQYMELLDFLSGANNTQ